MHRDITPIKTSLLQVESESCLGLGRVADRESLFADSSEMFRNALTAARFAEVEDAHSAALRFTALQMLIGTLLQTSTARPPKGVIKTDSPECLEMNALLPSLVEQGAAFSRYLGRCTGEELSARSTAAQSCMLQGDFVQAAEFGRTVRSLAEQHPGVMQEELAKQAVWVADAVVAGAAAATDEGGTPQEMLARATKVFARVSAGGANGVLGQLQALGFRL